MYTDGVEAASSNDVPLLISDATVSGTSTVVAKEPDANASTASPTSSSWLDLVKVQHEDTTPEQSAPGGPGSPGYAPKTFKTSRKLIPTL